MPLNFVAKFAITAAMTALNYAVQASRRIEGPRLDSTDVSTADYGTPWPRFWGIRRFEGAPILWAETLREQKVTSKTKGGKYSEYKYYGTWASGIADVAIDAVTRIWLDKHLVFDRTGTGPISVASLLSGDPASRGPVKLAQGRNMRIYLGTEDQMPDPRMEAWCEDRYGPDSCPAYRGRSYIVFEEIPLEKFGNRIPQVTIEAVRVKAALYPFETRTTALSSASAQWAFSPSGHWGVRSNSNGGLEWWDIASRTNLGTSPSGPGWATGSGTNAALASDGTAYQAGVKLIPTTKQLAVTSPLGPTVTTDMDAPTILFDTVRVLEYDGVRWIYVAYREEAGYSLAATHVPHAQCARDFALKSDGSRWGLFHPTGTSDQFTIEDLETPANSFTVTGLVSRSGPSAAWMQFVDTENHWFVVSDGKWYAIDADDGSTKASGSLSGTPQLEEGNPYATSFWVQANPFREYSLADGSLIRSIDKSLWAGSPSSDADYAHEAVTDSFWSLQTSSSNVTIRYLDRVGGEAVTLGTIVDEVCDWIGVTDHDVSLLTQEIDGYSFTQGPAKDVIEPLLDLHDVDPVPHGFGVRFVPRGAAAAATIAVERLAKGSPRYRVQTVKDSDLPESILVTFADPDADQQANTVRASREGGSTDSKRVTTIDLTTLVMAADDAKGLADRYFRRAWNDRSGIDTAVTMAELLLGPGDTRFLALDEVDWAARLVKMVVGQSSIRTEWKRDDPSLHDPSAEPGSPIDGRDPEVIVIPGPSQGFVLDVPLLADVDSQVNPLLYYGAGPFIAGSWPGASIYESDLDGDDFALFANVDSASKASWGIATTALGDVATPWLWDRGNSVTLNLRSGTLTSYTEAEIDADPSLNQALIGQGDDWEVVQFSTATLAGGTTWTLSGFKRGRRGTERETGGHGIGDLFVLADKLGNEQVGLSAVGQSTAFRTQTIGRDPEAAASEPLTFTGASLKPYAPAAVAWEFDGTDLTGTITRRTRVGGAWVGGSTIPLSENSEAYEVDVYNGATFKRTIPVSGTNVFTYTAAMAAEDGITLPAKPTLRVYQMSDSVGRGFALAA